MHWFRIFLASGVTLTAFFILFGVGDHDNFWEYLVGCIAVSFGIMVVAALCVLAVFGFQHLWQWALP